MHEPFRAWALQHDLTTLLGGSAEWRSTPKMFGSGTEVEADDDAIRGQGHLRSALETDPRIALRIRTSVALWSAAFVTDIANQVSPYAISMPAQSFWPMISIVLLVILCAVFVYPRLAVRHFMIAEQSVMTLATLVVFYQCSVTGGAGSPYLIWFLLTTYYAAYLMPAGQARANLVWISAICILTLVLPATEVNGATLLQMAAMLVTIQVATLTLIRQRRREDTVERAVTFMALADPLTAAANMRSFEEYFDHLLRIDGQRAALLVVDMNGLKGANSVFGHAVGDDMLVRLARMMREASGERDQVARFGGDEFAVVIPNGRTADIVRWRKEFELLVERHNASVRGRLPQISVAIGSAVYPDDGIRVSELIDVADKRMYEEKKVLVPPPHEIDGIDPGDSARAFRASQAKDAPPAAVDLRDRLLHGAVNWFACGSLMLAAAAFGGPYVNTVAAAILGAVGVAFGVYSASLIGRRLTRSASLVLDIATLAYCMPVIWASGGSSSPLIIVLALPVAFYAQNFARPAAILRIAILVAGVIGGYVLTGSHTEHEFTYLLTAIAAMLILATVMQHSSNQVAHALGLLRRSAQLDRLTGLPNVFALRDELEAAVRIAEHSPGDADPALVIVDLDDFRRANTLAGHRGGDEVLGTVATLLKVAAGSAKVFRLGGDEFVILHRGLSERDLTLVGQRAMEAVAHEHKLGGATLRVEASVAGSRWKPGSSADDLLEAAEALMYEQKLARKRDELPPGRVLL